MSKVKPAAISTDKAPAAIGPYSQAIKTDTLVFVSGQLGLAPETGDLLNNDIQAETKQAMTNLKNILVAAGSSMERVLKITLMIRNMGDFPQINETYGTFFPESAPARSCLEASGLPRNANIEIDAIAAL